jgi:hypothetical protein
MIVMADNKKRTGLLLFAIVLCLFAMIVFWRVGNAEIIMSGDPEYIIDNAVLPRPAYIPLGIIVLILLNIKFTSPVYGANW